MSTSRVVTYFGLALGAAGASLFAVRWPWAITVAAGVFVLLLAFPTLKREFIRSRRSRRGLCPNCGYDLTGIRGICMECASEVTRAERQRAKAKDETPPMDAPDAPETGGQIEGKPGAAQRT